MPLESYHEKRFREGVSEAGGLCFKMNTGISGVPDRLIVTPTLCPTCGQARLGFIELKKEGEKPEPLQLHWLTRLRTYGIAATWRDNHQAAMRWFRRLSNGRRDA